MPRLDNQIIEVLETLEDNGYEAYLVGGAVRDLLLGNKIHDIDINTNATSDDIKQIFSHFKQYEIGKDLGTISIVLDKYNVDITPYRKEGVYQDHRRPTSVSFSNNLQEDLSRRDFTINALCMNSSAEVIDYYNGLEDLTNGIIRTVGNPRTRFEEDALRILRALRFKATLGFQIEEETSKAIFEKKGLLDYISQERKREELLKLLSGNIVEDVINQYIEVFRMFVPFPNTDNRVDNFATPMFRLAFLLDGIDSLKKLKFSKQEINLVSALIDAKLIYIDNDYEFITCLSNDNYAEDVLAFLCQFYQRDFTERYDKLKKYCATTNTLRITGIEIENLGYKKENIGTVKNILLEKIHNKELENRDEDLTRFLIEHGNILKSWN